MPHWLDVYPHDLYASVLLLDNKIENWKVVNYPKKTPEEFKGYWKMDRLNDYTCQWKRFVVNNSKEHNEVFIKLAPEWFKKWELAGDYRGYSPYKNEAF
jgi:hypothetical protein